MIKYLFFIVVSLYASQDNISNIKITGEISIPNCNERKLNKKIVFIVSKFCGHCKKSKPILDELIKKNELAKYYNCIDLSNEIDRKKLEDYKIEVIYTPTLIINCGVVIGSRSQNDYQKLIFNFKNRLKNEVKNKKK